MLALFFVYTHFNLAIRKEHSSKYSKNEFFVLIVKKKCF